MIAARPSSITRIFAELVRNSRRIGTQRNAPLKGGAELAVLVRDGTITLTIKRPNKPVGKTEISTFKRDCGVPADAEVLTPLEPREQHARDVKTPALGGFSDMLVPWFYVSFRWKDTP